MNNKATLTIRLIFILVLLMINCLGFASDTQSADQAFKLAVSIQNKHTVRLHWNIINKAYLYKKFIKLSISEPKAARLGLISFPKGEVNNNLVFGKMIVYRNDLTLDVPIKGLKSASEPVKLILSYQGCTDAGHCFPPVTHKLTVNFQSASIKVDNHTASSNSDSERIENIFEKHNVFWIMGAFLIFGILLAFTPCVLPMIPILSSIIIRGHDKSSKATGFFLSLSYVIGMALAYALLGLVISTIGSGAQSFLQNPYVIIMFGLVFVVLALSLFGLFEIKLPSFFSNKLIVASERFSGGGYTSVVIMGFLSALIVSPCVTPPLVGALAYIATTGNIFIGTVALFFLGFGMGLPLVFIAVLGKSFLPKTGKWMDVVKFIFGFLLLAVAVMLWQRVVSASTAMLLWGVFALIVSAILFFAIKFNSKLMTSIFRVIYLLIFIYGILLVYGGLKGDVDYLDPVAKSRIMSAQYITVTNPKDLNRILQIAKIHKRPVFIDFYADWCLDCKSMNISIFDKPDIENELKRFIWVRVDVTKNTKDDLRLEKYYGIFGPPAFIFYSASGQQIKSLGFVGIKSKSEVMRRLKQV